MAITHLPCIYLKASMPCLCALTSYSLISIIKDAQSFSGIALITLSRVLWQPLDQCPIAVQAINPTGQISSGNISYVFTRELNRELQQYSIYY